MDMRWAILNNKGHGPSRMALWVPISAARAELRFGFHFQAFDYF